MRIFRFFITFSFTAIPPKDYNEWIVLQNNDIWIGYTETNFPWCQSKMIFNNSIEEITITQTNSKFKMPNTIVAEKANISKKLWVLDNVKIIDYKGENKKLSNLKYQSSFDGEIIANLFSNLNSLNLYQL